MAKRGRPRKSKLDKAAVGIGRTLGQVMNRMDQWRKQRDEIAADLHHVVTTAQKTLTELGHTVKFTLNEGPLPRILASTKGKPGQRTGFTMSAAARAKISAAQKARWAKQQRAEKG